MIYCLLFRVFLYWLIMGPFGSVDENNLWHVHMLYYIYKLFMIAYENSLLLIWKKKPQGWPGGVGLRPQNVLLSRFQVQILQVLKISVLGQFIQGSALASIEPPLVDGGIGSPD